VTAIRLVAVDYDLALTQRQAAQRKHAKNVKRAAEAGGAGESKAAKPDWLAKFPARLQSTFKVMIGLKVCAWRVSQVNCITLAAV
jgi:hypothetical protein